MDNQKAGFVVVVFVPFELKERKMFVVNTPINRSVSSWLRCYHLYTTHDQLVHPKPLLLFFKEPLLYFDLLYPLFEHCH